MSNVIIISLIVLVTILLLREIACWYSKTNEKIKILKEIEEHLRTRQKSAS